MGNFDTILKTIIRVASESPETIFGGSVACILNGVDIDRIPNDIDVIVTHDYYSNGGFYDSGRVMAYGSATTTINGINCKQFTTFVDKLKFDVFYYSGGSIPLSRPIQKTLFNNVLVKYLHLADVMDFKKTLLTQIPSPETMFKHLSDLERCYKVVSDSEFNDVTFGDFLLSCFNVEHNKKTGCIIQPTQQSNNDNDDIPF